MFKPELRKQHIKNAALTAIYHTKNFNSKN